MRTSTSPAGLRRRPLGLMQRIDAAGQETIS